MHGLQHPNAGQSASVNRGITQKESRSDVLQGVGGVHSSDEAETNEPWQQVGGQISASEGALVCRMQKISRKVKAADEM